MDVVGIDVGETQLDVIRLTDAGATADIETLRDDRFVKLEQLLGKWKPELVAIDSPPRWALAGDSRLAEHQLALFGIQSYRTPGNPDKQGNPFFAWMKAGFATYKATAAAGYPLAKLPAVRHSSIEIFPYASAVVLKGCLKPSTEHKKPWRMEILAAAGVVTNRLSNQHRVDAALAALTALRAAQETFVAVGDPAEGHIVLPVAAVKSRYSPCGTVDT
jgi:predicted RNase H-like nuclease